MKGLISVRAYKWRDLYLRGPINGGAYICEGLYMEGLISEGAYSRNQKTVQNMLWQC